LAKYLQKEAPGTLQEEVASGEHVKRERAGGMDTPSGQVFAAHLGIVGATEHRQRAGQRLSVFVYVGLADREVSPQQRKIHLHELWVSQDLIGGAAQTAQLGEDVVIRQLMNWEVSVGKSRRAVPGDDHVDRAYGSL